MKTVALLLVCAAPLAMAQLSINIQDPSRPNAGDTVLDTNDGTQEINCVHNSVFIHGNKNIVTVKGTCMNVHVMGNENTVTVDRADRLVTEGNGNTVNYRYPNMAVMTPGLNNKVHVVK
jgi:hypothetical protein